MGIRSTFDSMRRELHFLATDSGHVVKSVIDEVAQISVDLQDPRLVARALASARVMDDPDCARAWPAAFARLMVLLDELHAGVDE